MTPQKANHKPPLYRRFFYKRNVQKFLILPTSLLTLNIVEEIVCYKAAAMRNPHVRAGALMAMFFCGFTLVGVLFAPLIMKALQRARQGGRKKGGDLGELLIWAILYAGIYYVYYLMYGAPGGVENILPAAWENTAGIL